MKKFLILISVVLILFACDRFEHKFEPEINSENYIIDFFNTFADSISTFPENIPGIMSFYNDDYNNNGVTKLDVENFYIELSLLTPGTLDLEAIIIDTTDNFNIEWRLIATELSTFTYLDSIITDVLLPTEDSFQFYGNQADMRNVIVELFTGQWCPNCPNVEEALHNLRMQYGSRFSYVEYHIGDQLAGDFSDIFSYYPNNGTLPFGIVNGNAHIVYSAQSVEEVQAEIEAAITPLLQEQLLVSLSNVQSNLTDSLLTGSVQIEIDPSIPTENLTLVAVLMEDYNDEYLNNHGDPHYNIVLKRTTFDISALNLDDPIDFEITDLDVLPQWYMDNTIGLPEDLTLVIWVQTLEIPYNQNTCAVYNVIEVSL